MKIKRNKINQINKVLNLLLNRKHNLLPVFGLFVLFTACTPDIIYNQYQVVDQTIWEKNKIYYFTFDIEDTNKAYDLFFEIRNNNRYPYQNLWLFCSEEQPIGPLQRDTLEFMLADEYGKWHGSGISLYQNSFPIHTGYQFPYPGQYTFAFRQGMRTDILPGIQEIGFRVQESALPARGIQSQKDKQ